MRLLTLLFSFKGRIGRRPYLLIAGPIVIIFALRPFWAYYFPSWLDGILAGFGHPLTLLNFGWVLSCLFLALDLSVVPLLAVSFKRLHDLRRSGLWALPYLLKFTPLLVAQYWLATRDGLFLMEDAPWLRGLMTVSYWYGLGLAVVLATMPSKMLKPSDHDQHSAKT